MEYDSDDQEQELVDLLGNFVHSDLYGEPSFLLGLFCHDAFLQTVTKYAGHHLEALREDRDFWRQMAMMKFKCRFGNRFEALRPFLQDNAFMRHALSIGDVLAKASKRKMHTLVRVGLFMEI